MSIRIDCVLVYCVEVSLSLVVKICTSHLILRFVLDLKLVLLSYLKGRKAADLEDFNDVVVLFYAGNLTGK